MPKNRIRKTLQWKNIMKKNMDKMKYIHMMVDEKSYVKQRVEGHMVGEKMLYIGNNCISISRIMKLPGFKEDKK